MDQYEGSFSGHLNCVYRLLTQESLGLQEFGRSGRVVTKLGKALSDQEMNEDVINTHSEVSITWSTFERKAVGLLDLEKDGDGREAGNSA
jgi:hypothetical protein